MKWHRRPQAGFGEYSSRSVGRVEADGPGRPSELVDGFESIWLFDRFHTVHDPRQ